MGWILKAQKSDRSEMLQESKDIPKLIKLVLLLVGVHPKRSRHI
jgi:hypothetical protein